MQLDFYGEHEICDGQITLVVIVSKCKGQWLLVRHKARTTWEIPGGHRELGEDLRIAASRELYEETGAREYSLIPMGIYGVTHEGKTTYGKLFFAKVTQLGKLPPMEIAEVKGVSDLDQEDLTYPLIQPLLFTKAREYETRDYAR